MVCRPCASTLSLLRGAAVVVLGSFLALGAGPASAEIQRIAAVVNDEAISGYDLEQRIKLVISSSGLQPTDEVLKRIEPQILRALVEERLEVQEAVKQKIKIDDKDIEQALGTIAHQNNMSAGDIQSFLARGNIDVSTLKDQIRANLAWTRLVNERFGARIYISDEDIKSEYDRLNQSIAQPLFLVGEIVLRVDSPDQDEEVLKTAERLEEQLHQGAPFQSVAQQFSQSSTAASGGDLGWVQANQLASEIGAQLAVMGPGQISKPIRTAGAYRIIFLRNKREAGKLRPVMASSSEGVSARRQIKRVELKQILLPLPKDPSAEAVQHATERVTALRARISNCGDVAEVAASDKALKVASLPMVPFSQVAPFFQQAVMATPDGQASQPFQSPMGIHIIVVCRRELADAPKEAQAAPAPQPAATGPDPGLPKREEVEGRLYNQQLSMMSRRYLRDLRRDAVVEYR